MKSIATFLLFASISFGAAAQTTITNGGFELWGNTVPAGDTHQEPTNWYSDQSGSSTASLGGQTCFQESSIVHGGTYSVKTVTISGPLSTVINGVVTTGVVNAPTFTKTDGYIGTVNYSNSSDDRRMSFTGKPDSLVGWYQYVQSTQTTGTGGANEQGKVRAILHTGDYYDPETPTTYHPDPTANKIADVTFLTPMSNVSTWTRFSVPFTYVSGSASTSPAPAYIMINVTPSANQGTSVTGSTLYLDDLEVVYVTSSCSAPTGLATGTITSTSAVLNWSASGALGSQYVVNTTSANPTGSGTATTGTTYTATGLTAGTTYYAHVRDSCGATSLSAWTTISFSTHTTGVQNVAGGDFGITTFPNPVNNELTVKISGAAGANGRLQLMDISGRVIKTMVVDASEVNLSTAGLSSGIYLIRYIDAEHIQTMRINKQ